MRTGWADLPPISWTAEELHDLHVVRQPAERQAATYLLRCLLRWIARYETWVIAKHGLAYRRRSLAGWHRPQVLPEEMPGRWLRLAAQAARCFPGRLDAETRKNACRQAQHSV
ncbi:MAG: hypothetical protein JNM56_24975 [Planctomycetia bacterium]|nr:hypothetical protein [Planctomycetia bacterium]